MSNTCGMVALSSNKFYPLSIPNIGPVERDLVLKAIDGGWISSVGPQVGEFEEEFAKYVGARFAVACSSGTAALHVALRVIGIGFGDEVLVPNMTFVATANAVSYTGAKPVLVDIDKDTLGVSVDSVRNFLRNETENIDGYVTNKNTGGKVKAALPVHMLGTPVDMQALAEVCDEYGLRIVEDATESLGSLYNGKMTGTLSEVACFSFNGNKLITTGGGGMLVTGNECLANKARHLTTTAKVDNTFFIHDEIGFNYRLVNILAALGLGQLQRVDEFLKIKRQNHRDYKKFLSGNAKVSLFCPTDHSQSNHWLNMISFSDDVINSIKLAEIIQKLNDNGIQSRPMWTLLYELPMYNDRCFVSLHNSKDIHSRSLMLPSDTTLSSEDIEFISSRILDLCQKI